MQNGMLKRRWRGTVGKRADNTDDFLRAVAKEDEARSFLDSVCVELTGKHVAGRSFMWEGIHVWGGEKMLVSLSLPTDLSARQTVELLRDINKAKKRQEIQDAE